MGEVRVVDRASKNCELKIKEALHIQITPDNNKFNRDIGLKLPGCWLSMLRANHLQDVIFSKHTQLCVYSITIESLTSVDP